MRFRGKSSAASCRAGAYPGGPVAAPEGALSSLRPCPVPPGGRAGTWIRAARPPVEFCPSLRSPGVLFRLRRRAVHTPRSSRFSSISASRVCPANPFGRSLLPGASWRFRVRLRAVQRTQAGPVIFRSGARKSSSSCTNPSSAGAMRSSRFLVCAAGEDRPFAAAPGAVDRLLGEAGTRAFFAPQAGSSLCPRVASGFVWPSRYGRRIVAR